MLEAIKIDFQRYYKIELGDLNPSFLKKIRLFLNIPGLQAILTYRLCHSIKIKKKPNPAIALLFSPICSFFTYLMKIMYGIDISHNSVVGPGFYIGHFSGIRINRAIIGKNCSIHQHVMIGLSSSSDQCKACKIGSNVWIGAHSIIKPGVSIGNDTTIAAGSVVTESLPTGVLAMGNPARVTQKDYNNSELL